MSSRHNNEDARCLASCQRALISQLHADLSSHLSWLHTHVIQLHQLLLTSSEHKENHILSLFLAIDEYFEQLAPLYYHLQQRSSNASPLFTATPSHSLFCSLLRAWQHDCIHNQRCFIDAHRRTMHIHQTLTNNNNQSAASSQPPLPNAISSPVSKSPISIPVSSASSADDAAFIELVRSTSTSARAMLGTHVTQRLMQTITQTRNTMIYLLAPRINTVEEDDHSSVFSSPELSSNHSSRSSAPTSPTALSPSPLFEYISLLSHIVSFPVLCNTFILALHAWLDMEDFETLLAGARETVLSIDSLKQIIDAITQALQQERELLHQIMLPLANVYIELYPDSRTIPQYHPLSIRGVIHRAITPALKTAALFLVTPTLNYMCAVVVLMQQMHFNLVQLIGPAARCALISANSSADAQQREFDDPLPFFSLTHDVFLPYKSGIYDAITSQFDHAFALEIKLDHINDDKDDTKRRDSRSIKFGTGASSTHAQSHVNDATTAAAAPALGRAPITQREYMRAIQWELSENTWFHSNIYSNSSSANQNKSSPALQSHTVTVDENIVYHMPLVPADRQSPVLLTSFHHILTLLESIVPVLIVPGLGIAASLLSRFQTSVQRVLLMLQHRLSRMPGSATKQKLIVLGSVCTLYAHLQTYEPILSIAGSSFTMIEQIVARSKLSFSDEDENKASNEAPVNKVESERRNSLNTSSAPLGLSGAPASRSVRLAPLNTATSTSSMPPLPPSAAKIGNSSLNSAATNSQPSTANPFTATSHYLQSHGIQATFTSVNDLPANSSSSMLSSSSPSAPPATGKSPSSSPAFGSFNRAAATPAPTAIPAAPLPHLTMSSLLGHVRSYMDQRFAELINSYREQAMMLTTNIPNTEWSKKRDLPPILIKKIEAPTPFIYHLHSYIKGVFLELAYLPLPLSQCVAATVFHHLLSSALSTYNHLAISRFSHAQHYMDLICLMRIGRGLVQLLHDRRSLITSSFPHDAVTAAAASIVPLPPHLEPFASLVTPQSLDLWFSSFNHHHLLLLVIIHAVKLPLEHIMPVLNSWEQYWQTHVHQSKPHEHDEKQQGEAKSENGNKSSHLKLDVVDFVAVSSRFPQLWNCSAIALSSNSLSNYFQLPSLGPAPSPATAQDGAQSSASEVNLDNWRELLLWSPSHSSSQSQLPQPVQFVLRHLSPQQLLDIWQQHPFLQVDDYPALQPDQDKQAQEIRQKLHQLKQTWAIANQSDAQI